MVTPNMTCPEGGRFYACGDGSRFVGCCLSDPCAVGCPAGNLVRTSFDAAQYGQIPDQECSSGGSAFYTCAYTEPTWWGCCSSAACASTTGCNDTDIGAAFLSQNPDVAEPFLLLNTTWSEANPPSSGGDASGGGNYTGAIAGGVVGGIAVLVAIIVAVLWYNRRRKRIAASKSDQPEVQQQQQPGHLQGQNEQGTALKYLPQSYNSSPMMPSYHSSPQQNGAEWSPQPPSYHHQSWGQPPPPPQQRLVSELPGSDGGVEMEGVQPARNDKSPSPTQE